MDQQVMEILNMQEAEEEKLYQSLDAVLERIEDEFHNSRELIKLLQKADIDILQYFQRSKDFPFQMPVPVRTTAFFQIHKHTNSQITYLHTHDFYELIYVIRGNSRQKIKNMEQDLFLQEHQACLLSPGIVHSMGKCGEQDIILKLNIPQELFQETAGAIFSQVKNCEIMIFENCSMQADFCIYMLLKEYANRREYCEEAVRSYLTLLFIDLVRRPENQTSQLMSAVEIYLEQHMKDASLHEFASQMGYSDIHTGRLIRAGSGKSFQELLLEKKLQKASKLLLETNDTVSEIAVKLGYTNISGLYKQFSHFYGMAPGNFRKIFAPNAVWGNKDDC